MIPHCSVLGGVGYRPGNCGRRELQCDIQLTEPSNTTRALEISHLGKCAYSAIMVCKKMLRQARSATFGTPRTQISFTEQEVPSPRGYS